MMGGTAAAVICAVACPGAATFLAIGGKSIVSNVKYLFSSNSFKSASRYFSNQITKEFNRNHKSGLADAVNRQLKTGEMVGGKDHLLKGREAINWANRQLKAIYKSDMSPAEKAKLTNQVSQFRDEIRNAFRSNGQKTK